MLTFESTETTDDVATALIAAIEANKMRLVAHINGQANAAKLGKIVPADQILEVFRPDFAIRVWQACKPAGMDIPLRIHLYENTEGNTVVAFRTAEEIFAPYGSPELSAIGTELDAIFMNILKAVTSVAEETSNA